VIDQTTQAIFTVGVPTLAVLVGILVNNSRLSDLRAHMDSRFSAVDARFSAMEKVIDARFEAAQQALLRFEGVLDARLTSMESRLNDER
jgi:hypothetical protein